MSEKYLFGPVPSRRLGISLGVDLIPHKTCSLDCVYCEAGDTTDLLTERREYVPIAEVIAELDRYLAAKPELDFITFSGAGEPTLNSGVGKVVEFIKANYPQYKLCMLTNATLFNDEQLVDELAGVDLVIPSLDASNEEQYRRINRPCPGLTFDALVDGLVKFRHAFKGAYWLELFVVPGVNDSDDSISRFADIIWRIAPDKVQLNTLDRPGCVDWIKPAPEETLMRFIHGLEHIVPVESVGRFKYRSYNETDKPDEELEQRIAEMVSRRPATLADLCLSLAVNEQHLSRLTSAMVEQKRLAISRSARGKFFTFVNANV